MHYLRYFSSRWTTRWLTQYFGVLRHTFLIRALTNSQWFLWHHNILIGHVLHLQNSKSFYFTVHGIFFVVFLSTAAWELIELLRPVQFFIALPFEKSDFLLNIYVSKQFRSILNYPRMFHDKKVFKILLGANIFVIILWVCLRINVLLLWPYSRNF